MRVFLLLPCMVLPDSMISPRHALLGLALLTSTSAWSAPPRQDARTNGAMFPPFLELSTLRFDIALVDPPLERFFLVGRSESRVGLVFQVPGAGPQVWSYDVAMDTTPPVEVAQAGEKLGAAAAWSPNGRVAFARKRADGQFELVLARYGTEQMVDVAADELFPLAD